MTLALGIMSGTSIDNVDYALCEMGETKCQLRAWWSQEFPTALHRRLHAAARGEAGSWETGQLHHDLGRFYVKGAVLGLKRQRPALIGLHGQTIYHQPDGKAPATFQLGEPAYLTEQLRVPVVSNFRANDLAAGGQGAPLATLFHVQVFGRRGAHVCVNNLGGISNVTSIDWRRGAQPRVRAFDTGPANVLMDLAARDWSRGRMEFDRHGAWAAQGTAHERLLAQWLRHPFFKRRPPKSTGREMFGEPFYHAAQMQLLRAKLSKFDTLATFAAFTARSLADNYRQHLPHAPVSVILTGGGAANKTLVALIRSEMQRLNPQVTVMTSEALGWPPQAIEPAAFALLAWRRWRGKPGNLPATTGARHAVLCGQLSLP